MLQHSRIRATYNIDGTAGGDCVQSYYCPCCTLMQDEREVLARERRIIRQQRGDGDVREQPGFEPQMRYSTSNLLEEIPEIYRDHVNQGSYPSSTQDLFLGARGSQGGGRRRSLDGMKGLSGSRDGRHGHEMDDLQPFSLGQSDADTSDFEDDRRNSKSRRSSNSSGKLRVRETSPLGSALNPITVSRSASLDHGLAKNKQPATNVPQRSVTSPTRRRSLKDTNPPAAKSTNYRLKSIITDERPDFLIETIREGSESSNFAMTTTSRTAVRSLAMDSLRSHTTKNTANNRTSLDHGNHKEKKSSSESQDEQHNDEAYTTFYNDKGKLLRRRISECLRPRASSPETPEIYALHHSNPADDKETIELKTHLASEASIKRAEKDGQQRLLLKLKMPSTSIGKADSVKTPSPTTTVELVPPGTSTIAKPLSASPNWLGNMSTPSSSQYHTTSEHSGPSSILSLPPGVNDADDLASYLDQAVEDSELKPKNQKSIDRSAMPVGAFTGNLPPRKQTLRLDFNSEDEGTDTVSRATTPTQKDIKPTFTVPSFGGCQGGDDGKAPSPKSSVKQDKGTREAIDHYPSNIASSDGAGPSPLGSEMATPIDTEYYRGRHTKETDPTKEFGELTPRHKKSVSDWFKDIGRSNSNKSEKEFVVKVSQSEVPPVPVLPAQFKEGYSLEPLRAFSPLGFKGMLGSGKQKERGKSAFSTMGRSRAPSEKALGTRTVSMPHPTPPELFKVPLTDTTNNAEALMETQDKLQILQEEFKLMAEDIVYERNNKSPRSTPAAVDDDLGGDYIGRASPLMLAMSTSSTDKDDKTPTKLGQRSYPLVNSAHPTPKSSLAKATATKFLVSSGAVDIDHSHSRHDADICNANTYDKKTLMSTIKEISVTPVYGTDSPTTFAQSLMNLDLPSNLETPSEIPEGYLEHMPGEFPVTPALPTPVVVELEEVVVEVNSPVKFFGRPILELPARGVGMDGVSTASTTGSNSSTQGGPGRPSLIDAKRASFTSDISTTSTTGSNASTRPVTTSQNASFMDAASMTSTTGSNESTISDGSRSSGSGKSGHIHENQEVEVANAFNSTSAAEAMNKTTAARVVSANIKTGRDSDPFSHPFFSGTAVMDFALVYPRKMRQELADSDEVGSEETIRPAAEANPLGNPATTTTVEENPMIHLADAMPVPRTNTAVEAEVLRRDVKEKVEVLNGDNVLALAPPPDHPTTTERMDDALAAITQKPRASSMHGALAKPVIESDELRNICDEINRGNVVYETSDDEEEEIVTVGPNGPVTLKKRGEKSKGSGVGRSDTVVRRAVSDVGVRGAALVAGGNERLQAAIKDEVGGVPKVSMGEAADTLVVHPVEALPMSPPVMPAASPKRVHSPAEVMLRGMLGKVTAKVDAMAEQVKGDGRGGGAGGEGNGGTAGITGTPKKKRCQNSPQRRRNRAEKKRREKAEEQIGKL